MRGRRWCVRGVGSFWGYREVRRGGLGGGPKADVDFTAGDVEADAVLDCSKCGRRRSIHVVALQDAIAANAKVLKEAEGFQYTSPSLLTLVPLTPSNTLCLPQTQTARCPSSPPPSPPSPPSPSPPPPTPSSPSTKPYSPSSSPPPKPPFSSLSPPPSPAASPSCTL